MSQVLFESVLAAGRVKGQLTQDELIEALHTVELTPEVLATLIHRIEAEGVVLVEDEVETVNVVVEPRKKAKVATRSNGAADGRRETNGKRPAVRANRPATRRTPSTPT